MALAVKVPKASDVQRIANCAEHHGDFWTTDVQNGAANPTKKAEQTVQYSISG